MTCTTRGSLASLIVIPLLVGACASNNGGGAGSGSGGHSGSGGASSSSGSGGTFGSGGNSGGNGSGGGRGSGGASGSGGSRTDAGVDMTVADARGGTGGARGGSGGSNGSGGASGSARCQSANLTWQSANKTNFESYPAPGSVECIQFSGCQYEGMFAACPNSVEPESWVMSHNIVAAFPLGNLALHDLCLKAPDGHTIVVTVYDTCSDSDCSGCCTQNRGNASLLVDVEKYTDQRFGVADGPIQWADLGPTTGGGCQ